MKSFDSKNLRAGFPVSLHRNLLPFKVCLDTAFVMAGPVPAIPML
ncbi:hypothetical protein [Microvirga sp. Mcv34]|nr:hypothetical protein [Microvirga sp. Mcv34]